MIKKHHKYVEIMGTNILSTEATDLLTEISSRLQKREKFSIFTVNPELLLLANNNPSLTGALNSSSMNVADGVGILSAARFLKNPQRLSWLNFPLMFLRWLWCFYILPFNKNYLEGDLKLIKGRALFDLLIKLSAKKHYRVFLLGGRGEEARIASEHLGLLYPNLKIAFNTGPEMNKNAEPASEVDKSIYLDTVSEINNFKPHILFVAFGNPKQEVFINKNLSKLNVGGAMAVGGTFRYVAGLSKLPPKWIEQIGLEWLWRVTTEPYRFRRILDALIKFPMIVFSEVSR